MLPGVLHFFGLLAQPSISVLTSPPPEFCPAPTNRRTECDGVSDRRTNQTESILCQTPLSPLASRLSQIDGRHLQRGKGGRTFLVWPMLLNYTLFLTM